MSRLLTSLVLSLALTGCGEVVVFGHVVRENPAKSEAAAAKPATEPATDSATPQPAATAAAAPEPAAHAAATEPEATEHAIQAAATEPAAAAPATVAAAAPATVAVTPQPATVAHRLHAVNVTVSPASQAGDASVDPGALLDAIRTELRSRNLLDEQNPSAGGTAEVLIESATARPTVNAVIFGRQPMAGTLTGELHVSSASGAELPPSRIVAESRFNVPEDGKDKNVLGPLYRRFAVLAADELTGIAANKNAVTQPQNP
jgi:hypothetical protein